MTTPTESLKRSRVDVIAMIADGIPEREYVPGAHGLLPKAKRVHISAERKTGKSISIAVVSAVQIVAAGGTVAVLDRENGPDEFARRLGDVLDAREADGAFREEVRERLRYHAWPTLSLAWRDDPDYAKAFGDTDVVIFDSSRSHLTPLGLKEDQSDDFAAFTGALIDPLMRTGRTTTITLDNTGHVEKDRARGTSAKEDLCDIALTMRALSPFSSTVAGRLELRCTASRLGEITGIWQMELGGGHYGSWKQIGARPPEARDELREAAVEVLVAAGGPLGTEKVGKAIRARPDNALKFSARTLREGLEAWAADPTSGVLPNPAGKGFLARVGALRHDPHVKPPATRPDTTAPDTAEIPAATGDMPMSSLRDTARHGGHVAVRPPYGGDTADTLAENGADELPEGWTMEELEDVAASVEVETA